jgi:hypothetical protein
MVMKLAPLLLSLFLGVTQADKDDSYYMAGSGNPNVDLKMYWKDADNILADLSNFTALYVEFHSCAWTMMKNPESSDQDNDVDESDYWYLGMVPPMGANVAYSLYGSLRGETFSGCNKGTFINSFYTNTGYNGFAKALYYAGVSGFSSYSSDDDDNVYSSAQCQGGYGVGCTASNGFTMLTYASDECNPSNVTGVKDTMYNLNSAMKTVQCTQIYSSSSYANYPYVYGTALELLAYSSACFYQNFWSPEGSCPDPFGMIQYYQQNFNAGIKRQRAQDPYVFQQALEQGKKEVWIGTLMFMIAGAFLLCNVCWPAGKLSSRRKTSEMNEHAGSYAPGEQPREIQRIFSADTVEPPQSGIQRIFSEDDSTPPGQPEPQQGDDLTSDGVMVDGSVEKPRRGGLLRKIKSIRSLVQKSPF